MRKSIDVFLQGILIAFAVILSVIIVVVIATAITLFMGLIGYGVGYTLELVASPLIYPLLDVIPTQPFTNGDIPNITALLLGTLGILKSGRVTTEIINMSRVRKEQS